jgi:hypothetical protein
MESQPVVYVCGLCPHTCTHTHVDTACSKRGVQCAVRGIFTAHTCIYAVNTCIYAVYAVNAVCSAQCVVSLLRIRVYMLQCGIPAC